jgi:hypothetical protein
MPIRNKPWGVLICVRHVYRASRAHATGEFNCSTASWSVPWSTVMAGHPAVEAQGRRRCTGCLTAAPLAPRMGSKIEAMSV